MKGSLYWWSCCHSPSRGPLLEQKPQDQREKRNLLISLGPGESLALCSCVATSRGSEGPESWVSVSHPSSCSSAIFEISIKPNGKHGRIKFWESKNCFPPASSPVVFNLNPFHEWHPLHWGEADTPRTKTSVGCLNKSFFTDNGDADGWGCLLPELGCLEAEKGLWAPLTGTSQREWGGGRAVTFQQCSKPKEKMEQLMGGKFPKQSMARACVTGDAWGRLLSADPLG